MVSPNFSRVGVLVIAMLIGMGALVSHARQNNPAANGPDYLASVASVDMSRLYAGSGASTQYEQKLLELENVAEQQIRDVSLVPMLNQQELTEYLSIATRTNTTDAQQTRLKDLKQLSNQRTDELRTLQSKDDKAILPADKTRLAELTQQTRVFREILPRIADGVRADQKDRLDGFRQEQIAKLRVVVGQVARAKGYSHVFDVNSLVYSVNDVTTATLEQLTKHK